jgi:hypothetical protein
VVENYKILDITCPICEKTKSISVPENVFSQKKNSLIRIQLPQKVICEHQFIAFVNSKGKIQGYEKIDVEMSLAEETEKEKMGILTLRKLLMLAGPYGLFSIIHAIIFNYPIYLVIDENFKYNEDLLNRIVNKLLPEGYKYKKIIYLIKEKEYQNTKIDKNFLVLDVNQRIFQTPWDSKLKFEEELVKRALDIINEEQQFLVLQNSIGGFVKEVEYTVEFLKDEKIKTFYEGELIQKLSKTLMIPKINQYHLHLIVEFISQRISIELASKVTADYFKYLKQIKQKR